MMTPAAENEYEKPQIVPLEAVARACSNGGCVQDPADGSVRPHWHL